MKLRSNAPMRTNRHSAKSLWRTGAILLAMMATGAQAYVLEEYQPDRWKVKLSAADVGQTFQVDWLVPTSQSGAPIDISASGLFTLGAFTLNPAAPDSIVLDIVLQNTTATSYVQGGNTILTNEAILSFGFGVTPNATSVGVLNDTDPVDDQVDWNAAINTRPAQNFPGGFKNIDVCVYAAGCSGGAVWKGLEAGASDMLTLAVTGEFSDGEFVFLSDFPIKFQGEFGSFEPGGQLEEPPPDVPAPAPLALMLLGGLLLAGRRGLPAA